MIKIVNVLFILILMTSITAFAGNDSITVIILDQSGSMATTDKNKFSADGVQLSLALGGKDTKFAVVTFAGDAQVLSNLTSLHNIDNRYKIQKKIEKSEYFYTGTDFKSAFKVAERLIQKSPNATNKTVVFLTDGEDGNVKTVRARVMPYVKNMIAKGYNIYCINFAKDATQIQVDFLSEVSKKSRANFYNIEDPTDLVSTFLNISQDIESFLTYEGDFESVFIFPGTKRLVYIAEKFEKKDKMIIDELQKDGQSFNDNSKVYIYPKGNRKRNLAVLTIDSPPMGIWSAKIKGRMKKGYIMVQPPFRFDYVPYRPAREYADGDWVPIAIDMIGDTGIDMNQYKNMASFSTEIRSLATGKVVSTINLKPGEIKGKNTLRYSGWSKVNLTYLSTKEDFSVTSTLSIKNNKNGKVYEWKNKKTVLISVVPANKTALHFVPSEKNYGSIWSEDINSIKGTAKLVFEEDGELNVNIQSILGGFDVSTKTAVVSKNKPITVTYKINPEFFSRENLSEDSLIGRGALNGIVYKATMPIRVQPVDWSTTEILDLTPGYNSKSRKLNYLSNESYPDDIKWTITTLTGNGKIINVKIQNSNNNFVVTGLIDKTIPDGRYLGQIEGSLPNSKSKRIKKCFLDIKTSDPSLDLNDGQAIKINCGDKENVNFDLPVKVKDVGEAEIISAILTKMTNEKDGELLPGIDVDINPAGEWDGKIIKVGDDRYYKISVTASTDVDKSIYNGHVMVKLNAGTKTKDLKIPVTIDFTKAENE